MVQRKSFTYLVVWLKLKEVATLEPKPGVEPTVVWDGLIAFRMLGERRTAT